MTISGIMLQVNGYGLEFDSFLGAIYLPWHAIALGLVSLVSFKLYKRIKGNK
jgi:hypothetical protein